MDNLTHTLIGLLAGEVVALNIRAPTVSLPGATRRTALLALGMVGGNLPDVDLLWSMRFATGDQLTYLVEHRGYTHTLLGCAILTAMLVLGTLAVFRWRGHRVRGPDLWLFAAMSLFAVMLHLGMDALNEYGVHPFWPWNNRWYYGDAVFIVEPLCWLALAPLYSSLQKRGARLFLGAALAVGCIAVLVFHRFGAVWWTLPVFTLLLVASGRRLAPRAASWMATGLLLAVLGLFSITHYLVMQKVRQLVAVQFPAAATLDIVLSPAPAHPFCWDVILLQRAGENYVARLGQTTLLAQAPASEGAFLGCSRSMGGPGTAPMVPPEVPVRSGMLWTGEYSMNALELARLAASNCDSRRLASFLRAPFAAPTARGWIIGDLRYDREPGVGFAELSIDAGSRPRCPASSPWTAPRADLGFQTLE